MKDILITDGSFSVEVGQLVFDHVNGYYSVRRRVGFEEELDRLYRNIGLSLYGDEDKFDPYGEDFENDTFMVRAYRYDEECTCGYDDLEDEWRAKNDHDEGCYQKLVEEELIKKGWVKTRWGYLDPPRYMDLSEANEMRNSVYKKYCDMFGLSYPQGCAVHCTCSYKDRWKEFCEHNDHDPSCPVVLPNFWYKTEDFKLWWYKYPLRSATCNKVITLSDFREMIDKCIESLKSDKSTAESRSSSTGRAADL